MVYEGDGKYIFVSYAHQDSQQVLPIVEILSKQGFRVWYDSGIEAGTEWPEYVEDHLTRAEVVLVFMTPATVASRNCRNEINFALELQKEILVIYLEETELLKGMRLQLNSTQSLFRKNHQSNETFIDELIKAQIIQECREDSKLKNDTTVSVKNIPFQSSHVANVCSIGTNDENDIWPKGTYSQSINRDQFRVVFFHITLLKSFGFSGTISNHYQIYNSHNDLIYDSESSLEIEPNYDKISTGWILKGKDGSFVPSGDYRFLCSINHSPMFSYTFTVYSNADVKTDSKKETILGKIKGFFGKLS